MERYGVRAQRGEFPRVPSERFVLHGNDEAELHHLVGGYLFDPRPLIGHRNPVRIRLRKCLVEVAVVLVTGLASEAV